MGNRILIVGGGLQGLSVASSLRRLKYRLAIFSTDGTTQKSKLFEKHYYGSVGDEECLIEAINDFKPDVLIPMSDTTAIYLSSKREQIENKYTTKCAVPGYDAITIGADKSLLMNLCSEHGLPHPRTKGISINTINEVSEYVGFPALIKPNRSVGARGITKVANLQELATLLPNIIDEYGDCTLQQYIDNPEFYFNVMLYRTNDGIFPNYAISKIIRMYPISAGSSSCCISVEDDVLIDICKKTLEILNWDGFADFDVLYDIQRKEYKIIEINPRVPASLRIADISGINFPEIIVNDKLKKDLKHYTYTPGKILRFLGIDILWAIKTRKIFSAKPSWFYFFGKDVFYQDIYAEDSSTWITWLSEGIKKLLHH